MSHNITVEGGTSIRLLTAGKYCDRDIIVTATGGGGSENSFPTAAAGVYRHGSNFTELLYTWDEIWANGEKGEDWQGDYTMWDGAGYLMGTVGGDIILPDDPVIYPWGGGEPYWSIDLHCGNVVIPAWSEDCSSGISLLDFKSDDSTYGRPNSTIDCKLKTIYIKATTPPSLYMPKEYVPHLTKIVVPKGRTDVYKSATGWCDFAEIIVEEGAVGKSLAAKIIDQDPITEVTATDLQGLTKIPMETFSISGIFANCDSTYTYYYDTIEKITLPETVTEIAANGISYVSNLNSLTVLAKTPPTLGGSINGNAGGYTYPIYVPAASVDLYKAATNWSNYDIRAIA